MANRIIGWLDQRFPLAAIIGREETEYPAAPPRNAWWKFGSLAGFVLLLQIVTGVFLAMHYKADATLAFDSIQHIMRNVNYGWLIHYAHAVGTSAFFVLIYIHLLRALYYGAYRQPREFLWWTGLALLLLVTFATFMGALLPWGQMSFWGAQVITGLFGAIPLVGDDIVVWLRGGNSVGDATLTRFYALHYLIPFLIAGAALIHTVAALHTMKRSKAGPAASGRTGISLRAHYTFRDVFGVGVFLLVFFAVVFFSPDFFSQPENRIPANPLQTPANIAPEWYFLPLYGILRAIPYKFLGALAMALSLVVLIALPYLDRSRIPGGARYRPVFRAMFCIFVVDLVVLGYVGARTPEGALLLTGRLATLVYFGLFAFLPYVSKREEAWLMKRGLPAPVQAYLAEREPQPAKGDDQ